MPLTDVTEIGDAIIDLIKKNIIARSNVVSDVISGNNVISIENSFHFNPQDEIVLIDNGYNNSASSHYNSYEYAKIKSVANTNSIVLTSDIIDNWLVADSASVQKVLGHEPLFEKDVLYGDREVIPSERMSITVESTNLSNEWMYIQGGLSQEYSMRIMVYGRSLHFEEGRKVLEKYAQSIYQLLLENLHLDINNVNTVLRANVASASNTVVIEDTPENREHFIINDGVEGFYPLSYQLQDNNGASCYYGITNVSYSGGNINLTLGQNTVRSFLMSDFAIIRRIRRYLYDSRVSGINYGQVSKGSAILRAAELTWFGKEINEFNFPQRIKRV
jgi:hypothetical protein